MMPGARPSTNDIWEKAMEETGISYDFLHISVPEPWMRSFHGISSISEVTRKFMEREWEKAKQEYRNTQLPPGLLRLRWKNLWRRCML